MFFTGKQKIMGRRRALHPMLPHQRGLELSENQLNSPQVSKTFTISGCRWYYKQQHPRNPKTMARSGAKQTAMRGLLGCGGPPVSDFTETGPDSYHASFTEALTKSEIHIKCEGMDGI